MHFFRSFFLSFFHSFFLSSISPSLYFSLSLIRSSVFLSAFLSHCLLPLCFSFSDWMVPEAQVQIVCFAQRSQLGHVGVGPRRYSPNGAW